MSYGFSCFLWGVLVGILLCCVFGYILLLFDRWKEKHKLTQRETKVIINERWLNAVIKKSTRKQKKI